VVVALASAVVGCSPGHGHPALPNSSTSTATTVPAEVRTALVAPAGDQGLTGGSEPSTETYQVLDVDSRTTRQIRSPLPAARSRIFPYLVRQGGVVAVLDPQRGAYDPQIGTAYAITPDWTTAIRLGDASSAIPSTAPDRVWLATDNATPDDRLQRYVLFGTRRTVTEVDLTGHPTTPTYQLTGQRSILAAMNGGLLTSVRDGPLPNPKNTHPDGVTYHLELWDPATDQVVRRLPDQGNVSSGPMATSPQTFLRGPTACGGNCPVHLVDITTAADHELAPPPGQNWEQAVFSPDGRLLALAAHPPRPAESRPSGAVPAGDDTDTITVFDTTTAQQISTRPLTAWRGRLDIAWSPDSTWLFVTRDKTHVTYLPVRFPNAPPTTIEAPDGQAFIAVPPTP
jgi:dipeptidyl aminopeptidase/acylaminoacyl peptidase